MLSLRDGRAHGVLFDNTGPASRSTSRKADPDARDVYEAAGGDLVYYVLLRPDARATCSTATRR